MAQQGGLNAVEERRVKPSGPAAAKAADLLQRYTVRIEKEVEQERREVGRLRAELHELIDIRYDMANAITELRSDLAAKGRYSVDGAILGQARAGQKDGCAAGSRARSGVASRFVLWLGQCSAERPNPAATGAASPACAPVGPETDD
jgi:hypothetical protein